MPLNLSGQKRERPAALFRSGAANPSAGKVKEASRMYREASSSLYKLGLFRRAQRWVRTSMARMTPSSLAYRSAWSA